MGYPRQVHEAISMIYSQKKIRALDEIQRRRDEIYYKIPQIKEIDDEITNSGLELTKLALHMKQDELEKKCEKLAEKHNLLIARKKELLTKAGYGEDYMENVYECPKCKDTGYVESARCQCMKRLLIQEGYRQSNLAQLLPRQNFQNFDMGQYSSVVNPQYGKSPMEQMTYICEQSFEFIRNFSSKEQKNLFLFGPTGLGKTFLSSCIAKELLDQGYSVVYQSANRIFNMLTDAVFSRDLEEKYMVDSLYECDLLIIDDLGTEASTKYTVSEFFDILNTRLMEGKKLVINSNMSLQEVDRLYSNRISSRLAQFLALQFFGDDIRIRQQG